MCQKLVALFEKYPWVYDRMYVASFNPYILYRLRAFDRQIVTGYINSNHVVDLMLHDASDALSPVFRNCYVLHWVIDSTLRWFATPVGLNFLGCSVACIHQRSLSLERIDEYVQRDITLAAWTVNDPFTKGWLQQYRVSVISDNQF
jgi:hypothetical protein